jgi:hypothetical protein
MSVIIGSDPPKWIVPRGRTLPSRSCSNGGLISPDSTGRLRLRNDGSSNVQHQKSERDEVANANGGEYSNELHLMFPSSLEVFSTLSGTHPYSSAVR